MGWCKDVTKSQLLANFRGSNHFGKQRHWLILKVPLSKKSRLE